MLVILNAFISLTYFFAAQLGLSMAVVGNTVTLVWPPSGIALVAVLTLGNRIIPGILIGAFLSNAWTGLAPQYAAAIAIGNTLEAFAGGWFLMRYAKFRNNLERRSDILALIIIAGLFSTMIAATTGASTLAISGISDWQDWNAVWVKWWLGDMMGVLVFAPALLVCITHPWHKPSLPQVFELTGLVIAVSTMSYLIFGTLELAGRGYYPSALAVFPFVIWGALRFAHWGTVTVIAIVSVIAIIGTTQGAGPFAQPSTVDSLVGWCAFTNVMAVTGLLLAAFKAEQTSFQKALVQAHHELEERVVERTEDLARVIQELSQQIVERRRLETHLISISERHQRSLGQELHDGLGQHLTSLAFFGASLQKSLMPHDGREHQLAARIVEMVNDAIKMTRDISRGLYPVELESQGLRGALRQLLERTQTGSGIDCHYENDLVQYPISPKVAINLYRFAQEAINNAVKHSKAKNLTLELHEDEDNIVLSIIDDGIGISDHERNASTGVGLHSLRYRADAAGGHFSISNRKSGGCQVTLRFPSRLTHDHHPD